MDISLDAGVTLFDSADIYSDGLAEEILVKAIASRLHSTKEQGPPVLEATLYDVIDVLTQLAQETGKKSHKLH